MNKRLLRKTKSVNEQKDCLNEQGFAIKSQNPRIFGDSELLINAIAGYPFRNSEADSFLKFYCHHAFSITVFQSNYCNVHLQHFRIKCVKFFIALLLLF